MLQLNIIVSDERVGDERVMREEARCKRIAHTPRRHTGTHGARWHRHKCAAPKSQHPAHTEVSWKAAPNASSTMLQKQIQMLAATERRRTGRRMTVVVCLLFGMLLLLPMHTPSAPVCSHLANTPTNTHTCMHS